MKYLTLTILMISSFSWAHGNGVTTPSTGIINRDATTTEPIKRIPNGTTGPRQQREEAEKRIDLMEQKNRMEKESPLYLDSNKTNRKIKEKGDTGY
jgi:hypothetical protein